MTYANPTSAAETVELSTEYRLVFITAREVARLDADDDLDAADFWRRSP